MNLNLVRMIDIPTHEDQRGVLSCIEQATGFPFGIQRVFYIHRVKHDRGGHANRITDQVLIPLKGSLRIRLFDGNREEVFHLARADQGLLIPHMVFLEMYDFSEDAICLVIASAEYNEAEYIRSRDEYTREINSENQQG